MKLSVSIQSELVLEPAELAQLITLLGKAQVATHTWDSNVASFGKKEPMYTIMPFSAETEANFIAAEKAGLPYRDYLKTKEEGND